MAVKLAYQNIVEVPDINDKTATQLLQKCLVNQDLFSNEDDTKAPLAQLINLPLAIVQAAVYINENGIIFADYLSLLAAQEEEVIELLSEEFEDDGRYHDVKNPVATTQVKFDRDFRFTGTSVSENLPYVGSASVSRAVLLESLMLRLKYIMFC
jgi:hypothetical protein